MLVSLLLLLLLFSVWPFWFHSSVILHFVKFIPGHHGSTTLYANFISRKITKKNMLLSHFLSTFPSCSPASMMRVHICKGYFLVQTKKIYFYVKVTSFLFFTLTRLHGSGITTCFSFFGGKTKENISSSHFSPFPTHSPVSTMQQWLQGTFYLLTLSLEAK